MARGEFSGECGLIPELFVLTCALLSGLFLGSVLCFNDLFFLDRRMNEQANESPYEIIKQLNLRCTTEYNPSESEALT